MIPDEGVASRGERTSGHARDCPESAPCPSVSRVEEAGEKRGRKQEFDRSKLKDNHLAWS